TFNLFLTPLFRAFLLLSRVSRQGWGASLEDLDQGHYGKENMKLIAAITNNAVPAVSNLTSGLDSGQAGASVLGRYIAVILQTSLVVGGLAVLFLFVQGAIEWITAGGESAKVDKARSRITNAVIGLAVLSVTLGFANFIGPIFGFDLLQLNFINQL